MSWLYGQTWLWYLLAFLVGVLLAWLLLVLPAERRLRSLDRGRPAARGSEREDAAPASAAAAAPVRDEPGPHVDDAVTEQFAPVDPALAMLDTSRFRPEARGSAGAGGLGAAGLGAAGLGAAGLAAAAAAREDDTETTREIPRVSAQDGTREIDLSGTEATRDIPIVPPLDEGGAETTSLIKRPGASEQDSSVEGGKTDATTALPTTTGADAPADGEQTDPAPAAVTDSVTDSEGDTAVIDGASRSDHTSRADGDTAAVHPTTADTVAAAVDDDTTPAIGDSAPDAPAHADAGTTTDAGPGAEADTANTADTTAPADEPVTPAVTTPDSGPDTGSATAAGSTSGTALAAAGLGAGAVTAAAVAHPADTDAPNAEPTGSGSATPGTDQDTPAGVTGTDIVSSVATTEPAPDVEPTPDATGPQASGTAAAAGAAAATPGTGSDDEHDRPYGPGSLAAAADGSSPDPAYRIKGNTDTSRYHTSSSPYFERTRARVWFRTTQDAERAGFVAWNTRGRIPHSPQVPATPQGLLGTPAEPEGNAVTPGRFPGSALPLEGGASPSPAHTVKGNADSMLYHTVDSPHYGRTKAEVWFTSTADAEAAGFSDWRRRAR